MDSFNGHIFVEKLTKLNNSQQSIETLSHWCIFHRKKAKHVVETWERQFHVSPQEQRVSFLYLANDILQNNRRKGTEFVTDFWRVLPDALNDVLENGDESGRKAVLRLIDIWDERKVFGSRGHVLKEEISRRNPGHKNKNGVNISYKLKQGSRDKLEKLIYCHEHVYDGSVDEDNIIGKSQSAINLLDELKKKVGTDVELGNLSESGVLEELRGQYGILNECIEQLKSAESARSALLSNLREYLTEQEMKYLQIHSQLEASRSCYVQLSNIFGKSIVGKSPSPSDLGRTDGLPPSHMPFNASPDTVARSEVGEQTNGLLPPHMLFNSSLETVVSSRGGGEHMVPFGNEHGPPPGENCQQDEDNMKLKAAEMAERLVASTSSAEMLTYVLSSLASAEGGIGQMAKEEYPHSSGNKRPRLDETIPSFISPQTPPPPPPRAPSFIPQTQPPPPPFPHPDSLHLPPLPEPSSLSTMPQPTGPNLQPLQPPMPSVVAPPHVTQFMPSMPYSYSPVPPPRVPPPSYSIGPLPHYQAPQNPYSFQHPLPPPSVPRPPSN